MTALDLLLLFFRKPASPHLMMLLDARPAMRAAFDGDLEKLHNLPAAELAESLNTYWGGWTPLAVAAIAGQDAAAQWLLEKGATATLRVGPSESVWSYDLLSLAIMGGARGFAKRLVASQLPLDQPTAECCRPKSRERPLKPAELSAPTLSSPGRAAEGPERWFDDVSQKERPALVRLRPLHRAALAGQEDVVEALLAAGVDVNQVDDSGHKVTAAMLAASRGHVAVLKALARGKANFSLADSASCRSWSCRPCCQRVARS